MSEWVDKSNLVEAALWLGFALIFGLKAIRAKAAIRRASTGLAVTLLAFGASDLIEARTGAWWRPWWLAALKGACIVALARGFQILAREARRPRV